MDYEELYNWDKEIKLIPLAKKYMFKSIFYNDLDLLKKFVISQLDFELDYNKVNIKLISPELPTGKKKEYQKVTDILIRINEDIYIKLELGVEYFFEILTKHFESLDELCSLEFRERINTFKNKIYINIVLDADNKECDFGYDKIVCYGLKTKNVYNKNKYTLLKYPNYYKNLYYCKKEREKLKTDELWLALLSCNNFGDLYKIASKIMDKEKANEFLINAKSLSTNDFIIEQDELDKMNKRIEVLKEREIAEDAKERGIEQNKLDIVKKFLEKNYDLNEIADITELSKERILEIKNDMN